MKKYALLPVLTVLAACGACDHSSMTAAQICSERGYAKGSNAYAHCMVDERKAEKLAKENAARM